MIGLKRITYISGATAFEENRWFPMTAQKLAAEEAIQACAVSYTVFCPTWPMLDAWIEQRKAQTV